METRLESSLHNRVYIIPDKDKNPSQVEHPWNIDVKSGSKPKKRLPKNTHIIDLFDRLGVGGRLLILGKPGAGKTTMLLELAKVLVQRVEEDLNEPVPVLLSLSSWQNNQQSISDWIVAELNSGKYYKFPKNITKQWLKDGEIIPLLDGLDELAAERQEKCVNKINEFLQPGNWIDQLVVCSRIEEYQLYSTQLALNTSVELQPFNEEQIQDYLRRTGNEQLWNSIRDEPELRELAQTPFLLNVIVLSSQKLSLNKWQEFQSSAERLNYLLSAYVEQMLGRGYQGKRPSDENTRRWLGWLALKLIKQNETEFFIEKIQPTWLENKGQRLSYKLSYGLIVGLILGLFFLLSYGLIRGLIIGLSGGLIIGLSGGLIRGNVVTFKKLHFSLKKNKYWLSHGLIIGLISGLISGLFFLPSYGLVIGLIVWLIRVLVIGLIMGLVVGLMGVLVEVLDSPPTETTNFPNQGIRQSIINVSILTILIVPICAPFFYYFGLVNKVDYDLSTAIITTLGFALLLATLLGGGIPVMQHLTLRLILWRFGQGGIPWNYAGFLNYATDRLFLQRVGGGYRFIHDLLRQHFANQPLSALGSNNPRISQ
ncbi:MAG: NACHT domain-containing protein [Symploca sp. SIO1B1]|nr:NACHT domain-containing protein [Symploca sp. SIO1B1]